ncbi:NAD(P)H-dependent oxidoreductase [Staphylococcus simiae]|uniref:NAD(P)H-flavin oxidoreductase n=1 Tax=Staphylococcus simiae CCM 7213 = CCUG 51256 TaxID=911238 RepID=G5JI17_9STAP|nr:NAD(P)H-dependent oxidoreductase [Staphylococcus simiae]EHJ08210.1 NAD(P)H-flavin oxidoreductase [Staphylococcus simiae CCM 7213 = CCUG 51256]PNZ14260.1 NAD(P)H-dependent oxidoreductase [Staphylococcus simiae]SNV82023.1 NAD(P)H-dependent quinone reductase [Staphylococcus simiae]
MNNINQTIIDAFNFRHATKQFDSNKKIATEDFDTILEAARLSPSSLGLEPWKFLVIQDQALRDELKEYSWGAAKQLATASHFVLILARKNVTSKSKHVQHMIKDIKQYEASTIPAVEQKYDDFQTGFHINDNERTLYDWASKQTYIALGNMMTTAALLGIDSCPMEGFDLDKVTDILAKKGIVDTEQFGLSVMAAFGYRQDDPPKEKTRQAQEDVIEWIE